MNNSDNEFNNWYNWALFYLNSNFGNLLPGIAHNLQNTVHSYSMQLELWDQKLEQNALTETSDISKAVRRFHTTTNELSDFCDQLEQRIFYIQNNFTAVYLQDFINWQRAYWINNLFFKHYIDMSVMIDEKTPNILEIPPIILTLIIEESLKNAIEGCFAIDPKGHFDIELKLSPFEQGLKIVIASPTKLQNSISPWEKGSSTKQFNFGMGLPLADYFARLAGWQCSLQEADDSTYFILEIPSLKFAVNLLERS